LWIYISWLIMLSGALLTASLPLYEQASWHLKTFPGKCFYDALKILERLQDARKTGQAETVESLHLELRLDRDAAESILSDLSQHDFVKETLDGSWVLVRDAQTVMLSDIFRSTVFDPAEPLPDMLEQKISKSLDEVLGEPLEAVLKRR
ncbi:MAG TPA: hypothetical protein PLK99_13795, partial [Burkholderiales bacterium]|nr:hypothetical protein [Burkholderiales bacterium]